MVGRRRVCLGAPPPLGRLFSLFVRVVCFYLFFFKQAEAVQAMSVFIINVFPTLSGEYFAVSILGHTKRLFISSLDI